MEARHARWLCTSVCVVAFLALSERTYAGGCNSKEGQQCSSDDECDDSCSCTSPDVCNFGLGGKKGFGLCQTSRHNSDCPDDGFTCTTHECVPTDPEADSTTGCITKKNNPNNAVCTNPPPGGVDGFSCTEDECNPSVLGADDTTGCITKRHNSDCPDDGYTCTAHECVPTDPDANEDTGCITKKNNPNNPICNDYNNCTFDDCNPAANPKSTSGCVNKPTGVCCETDADCLDLRDGDHGCVRFFCNTKTHQCEEEPIPNCGACCLASAPSTAGIGVGPVCVELTDGECETLGGNYKGDGTDCDPNPCTQPRLSVSQKGSILFYSGLELKWGPIVSTAGVGFSPIQDTFITLVNDLNQDVCVEWHFINGDPPLAAIPNVERAHPGWNSYDCVTCLTPHENVYMSMLDGDGSLGCGLFRSLDPGTPPGRPDPDGLPGDRVLRGYAVAFAVDLDGNPISFNHLSGHVDVVNYKDRSAWEYNTYAFQCVIEPTPGLPCGADPTVLSLDGIEYELAFDRLLFDFYAVGSTAFSPPPGTAVSLDTDLTLYPVSVDLRPNSTNSDGPVSTRAEIAIWNENEDGRTGTSRCISCWDQTLLSDYDDPTNNFLIGLLGTDKGKARIDGVQADSCQAPGSCCCSQFCSGTFAPCSISVPCAPGAGTCGIAPGTCFDPDCDRVDFARGTPDRDCSEDAALLGISDKILTFSGAVITRTDAAMTLVGIGTQPAAIKRKLITPTAPLNHREIGGSFRPGKMAP